MQSTTSVSIGVAACTYVWTTYDNSNVNNGIAAGATTLPACLAACAYDAACIGADWINTPPTGQRCWLSRSGAINRGTVAGVTHYALVRDCTGQQSSLAYIRKDRAPCIILVIRVLGIFSLQRRPVHYAAERHYVHVEISKV